MRIMRPRGAAPSVPLTNYSSSSAPITTVERPTKRQSITEPPVTTTPTTTAPPITQTPKFNTSFNSYGNAGTNSDAMTTPAPVVTQPNAGDVSSTVQTPWQSNTQDVKQALMKLRGSDQMDYLNLLAVMEQNNGQLPSVQERMRWEALQKLIYPNYATATQPVTPPPAPLNANQTARTYNPNDPDPFGWKAWGEAYGDKKPVTFGEWWQRIPEYQFLKSKAGVGGWFQANKAFYNQMLEQYRLYAGAFPNPYTGKLNQFGGRKRFFVSPGDQT